VKPNGDTTVEQTVRVTYRQNWAAYNAAQTVEKERVANLLHALCSAIDNPVSTTVARVSRSLTRSSAAL
jgi:hypothetical protein